MVSQAQTDDESGFPKIAVVVPTFNRKEVTLRFLENIRRQSVDTSIYVCDSGSNDGTVQAVTSIPGVKLIGVGCEAWWSAAVNRGIDRALEDGHDAVLIMNDDIHFDCDLLTRLSEKHKSFPHSVISPLQVSPTGPFLGMRYTGRWRSMNLTRCADEDVFVDTTNGCCLLVPKEVFLAIPKMDEVRCPHQYGDTEFQLRAKSAGFPTLACPTINIYQLEATNYYARLRLGSMLNFPGSPLYFSAYAQFGATLFGSPLLFLCFGVQYHLRYMKTLAKAILHFARKKKFLR